MATKQDEQHANVEREKREPFLSIHGMPVYFREDWGAGIGGGLWSTGLALALYFGTDPAYVSLERLANGTRDGKLTVLELGSGNGFLAVCLASLAAAKNVLIKDLVVTDDEGHLDMIRKTVGGNPHTLKTVQRITIMKHLWGSFSNAEADRIFCSDSIEGAVVDGTMKFDLILGSDVAYRECLYDPLIRSIQQFSHSKTISLIGVTMSDTTPAFFHRLDHSGFVFQKLSDHLLEPEYRGTTFGIFVLQAKKNKKLLAMYRDRWATP